MTSGRYKKAQAFVWFGIIVVIFAMGLIYILLSEPFDKVSEIMVGNFTGTQYEPTYNKIQSVWDNFLILFLVGVMIYGITLAMKKNDPYY